MRIAPSSSRRRTALRLTLAFGLAGCVPSAQVGRTLLLPAKVAIVNLTGYAWQIILTPGQTGVPVKEHIAPRRTAEFSVAGGSYQIEQSIASASEIPQQPRRFAVTLKAGQSYRWPLATLQADSADSP